jgi:hypothetical protein
MTLAEKMALLVIFILNNETYLGEVREEEGTCFVKNAVKVVKNDDKETIKNWIKADNSNDLENFETTGIYNITKKKITRRQTLVMNSLVAQAEFIKETAVANLQNELISDL